MDGAYLTAARTAAGSALATRFMARPDADVQVIVGTGAQARAHALAIPSTTVPFLLLTYGRMLWGGAGDGSKGVFLQERVPSGGRI